MKVKDDLNLNHNDNIKPGNMNIFQKENQSPYMDLRIARNSGIISSLCEGRIQI